MPILHDRVEKGNEKNENQSMILKNLNDVVTPTKTKEIPILPILSQNNGVLNSNRVFMNGGNSKQNSQSQKHYLTPLNLPNPITTNGESRYNQEKCVITYNFDQNAHAGAEDDLRGISSNNILTHNIFIGWDEDEGPKKKRREKENRGNGKDYININKSVCKTIRNSKSICTVKQGQY